MSFRLLIIVVGADEADSSAPAAQAPASKRCAARMAETPRARNAAKRWQALHACLAAGGVPGRGEGRRVAEFSRWLLARFPDASVHGLRRRNLISRGSILEGVSAVLWTAPHLAAGSP